MALGELSALADAVCWAGTGVTTKRLGRAVRPVHVSAFLATASTAALVVISAATGQVDDIARTPAASLGLFALGAVLGAAGMLMFFITISMGSVGATYTTTSGLYILFSLTGGVLFLGDRAGVWTIIGAAAILAGVSAASLTPGRGIELAKPLLLRNRH
jgi:drug/metabolite transporter (DMT)-like permease